MKLLRTTKSILALASMTVVIGVLFQNCAPQFSTASSSAGSQSAASTPDSGGSGSQGAGAGQITLAWDPNTESSLAGYKIYYGPSATNYMAYSTDVGQGTSTNGAITSVIANLPIGSTYYFAVVAYDTSRTESPVSNIVSQLIQ